MEVCIYMHISVLVYDDMYACVYVIHVYMCVDVAYIHICENIISEEFVKGYMYRDTVVRYSKVKVVNC